MTGFTAWAAAFLSVVIALGPTANGAEQGHVPAVRAFVETDVRPWIRDPLLIGAIQQQNARHATLSDADINELDRQWRAGFEGTGHSIMIDIVAENVLSEMLRQKLSGSGGRIAEILVMDNRGLIVGATDMPSDFWQGDEDKFQKSFDAGPDALFIDVIEKDESSQALQSQASLTISDDGGKPIGAITIGVNIDAL
ncbi:hypothetical protein [Rhizobium sp. RU36D]|uniref:hypothetical protein n=1 Tax=Rhizobium sp. RU36D TaxID=1907415 RepID=UPI0009D8914E|nr:hypothetical protein [Rhizobium sp. RU36D]SMC63785.1 hypothetical protein SAMN05880593_1043 [Rhizobium sp. RU36D]